MRLRSPNSNSPKSVQVQTPHNQVARPTVVRPEVKAPQPQALKLTAPGKKKPISDREWAAKHGRGFIAPPQIVKGVPARIPVREPNGRHMVEATPPIGDVPDPNNAGNVLICHQKPDLSFVTLSIPPASLPLYQTPNNSDGVCTPTGTTYCPPGSAPDCAGVCNGTSIVDCAENCYDPVTTAAAFLLDCNNVCYDTSTTPLNVPDCNGVCGGSSVVDCDGVCDGVKTLDCAGVCDGGHFVDCGGNCNTACAEVAGGSQSSKKIAPVSRQLPAPQVAQPQRQQVAQPQRQQVAQPQRQQVAPITRQLPASHVAHASLRQQRRQLAIQGAGQVVPTVVIPQAIKPQVHNVPHHANTTQGHLKLKSRR